MRKLVNFHGRERRRALWNWYKTGGGTRHLERLTPTAPAHPAAPAQPPVYNYQPVRYIRPRVRRSSMLRRAAYGLLFWRLF